MSEPHIPGDASNVLLLTDRGDEALDICWRSITTATRVLAVSYTRPPRGFAARSGTVPAELVVVEATRQGTTDDVEGVTVHTEGPDNLTGLGVRSNEFLTGWHGDDAPVTVYFDSITALLQYAELDTAYRFLHVFTSRVTGADATGYYHLVPAAHDEATVATFKQLFDTVLTRTDDGSYEIRNR